MGLALKGLNMPLSGKFGWLIGVLFMFHMRLSNNSKPRFVRKSYFKKSICFSILHEANQILETSSRIG